ncbi:hypothetical protein BZA70DRAFT_282437 [Myxozyma melibiosi]|uniref:DH domain-containing protein n=1 Tax=Myxozyma melibiosi TaxID=54550 RepID=A0ABR1F244_9ASCO
MQRRRRKQQKQKQRCLRVEAKKGRRAGNSTHASPVDHRRSEPLALLLLGPYLLSFSYTSTRSSSSSSSSSLLLTPPPPLLPHLQTMSVSHSTTASLSMSLASSVSGTSSFSAMRSASTGYSFQRFNALTVDDLFLELKRTEQQYVQDLECIRDVHLVEELLIVHLALQPSLSKVLIWGEEAAPIYRQYVKEYVYDPDESEELRYLKRRPLVRLRFFSKFFKKLEEFLPNVRGIVAHAALYRILVSTARAKVESEKVRTARLKIEFSKVRSFDTLQPVATQVNPKWITARSYCQCHLNHRTGKTFEGLPVEIMLISEPLWSNALAICQLHELQRFLLFPTFRRADLVYIPSEDMSSLEITLKSYDESSITLKFSSSENKKTWASTFKELFPPAPALPADVAPRKPSLSGLQIISGDSEAARLDTEALDSELRGPRLFEEPELRPYIVETEISPKKKRHSIFRYGSGNSLNRVNSSSRPSVRFSRVVSESRISPSSSSTSLSPYKRLQQRLVEKQRSVSAIASLPSIQDMVLKEESPATSPELTRSPKENSAAAAGASPANLARRSFSDRRSSLMTAVTNTFNQSRSVSAPSPSQAQSEAVAPVKTPRETTVAIARLRDDSSGEQKSKAEFQSSRMEKTMSTDSVRLTESSSSGIYLVPTSAREKKNAASPIPRVRDPEIAPSPPVNRESVFSFTPETFDVSPRPPQESKTPVQNAEPSQTPQLNRKKSSFGFGRKQKDYILDENAGVSTTRSGSVSSVFRKITPRSHLGMSTRASEKEMDTEKAISGMYSRMTRRASTALANLSPNIGSPKSPNVDSPILSDAIASPASVSSEFSDYEDSKNHKRVSSMGFMRGLRMSRISMRSTSTTGAPKVEQPIQEQTAAAPAPHEPAQPAEVLVAAPAVETAQKVEKPVEAEKPEKPEEKLPEPAAAVPAPVAEPHTSMPSVPTVVPASRPKSTVKPEPAAVSKAEEPAGKTNKFSIFARNARKMRAALQSQQQPQPESTREDEFSAPVDVERIDMDSGTVLITTAPPSPSAKTRIIDVNGEDQAVAASEVSEEKTEEVESSEVDEPVEVEVEVLSKPSTANTETNYTTASNGSEATIQNEDLPVAIALASDAGTSERDDDSVYDDAHDDFPVPKVSPLKINTSVRNSRVVGESVLSPGYPPSPSNEIVDTSAFISTEEDLKLKEMEEMANTVSMSFHRAIKNGEHELFANKPELAVSEPPSPGLPLAGDETPIVPPSPLRVPKRGSSLQSPSSRASTLRDSQITVYADTQLWTGKRYSLRDGAMSDDAEEEEIPLGEKRPVEAVVRKDSADDDYYSVMEMSESSGSASDDEKSEDADEIKLPLATKRSSSALHRAESEGRTALKPKSVNYSIPGGFTSSTLPGSILKKEYDPSIISSGESDASSTATTTPSPSMKWNMQDTAKVEDLKIVLFKSYAFVSEWNNSKWERITPKEVRVLVAVTEGTATVEVWPKTISPSSSTPSSGTSTPAHTTSVSETPKTRSVMFNVAGDSVLNMNETAAAEGKPMLSVPLTGQSTVRRSTAFDVHLKRTGASGITMFRMRTAAEADHMISAIHSCRKNYHSSSVRSRPFGSSVPSIASSESSMSSGASMRLGRGSTTTSWYHPTLESPGGEGVFSADGTDEVMLIKDFKCRLFQRFNALKWRNVGAAKISVSALADDNGVQVCVRMQDGQVAFDVLVRKDQVAKLGKTGVSISMEADSSAEESKRDVYMLQFKRDKEAQILLESISEYALPSAADEEN